MTRRFPTYADEDRIYLEWSRPPKSGFGHLIIVGLAFAAWMVVLGAFFAVVWG